MIRWQYNRATGLRELRRLPPGPAWYGDRNYYDVLALALPLVVLGFLLAAVGAI